MNTQNWLLPNWPAPSNVKACVTTTSAPAQLIQLNPCAKTNYGGFNLALHVGDNQQQVMTNREFLAQQLGCTPYWLNQIHSSTVASLPQNGQEPEADASISSQAKVACAILSADCLPVLFANQAGTCVGAAHAGWRGLASGVMENCLQAMNCAPQQIIAWLGPAIGQCCFEVGEEVRAAFIEQNQQNQQAFIPGVQLGKWQADLYQLARLRLNASGVSQIYGGDLCSKCDSRFYSYRRQPNTGRFASLIWFE